MEGALLWATMDRYVCRGRIAMLTEFWESDTFTERREALLDTLETDYPWSKGDILRFRRGGRDDRYRVLSVQVEIGDEGLRRTVLLLKLGS